MTVPSEPLNVRVARALGWDRLTCRGTYWIGIAPGSSDKTIPPYGADTPEGWAVTGQLIEEYELYLERGDKGYRAWRHPEPPRTYIGQWAPTASAAVAEWTAEFAAKFGGPDAAR